MSDALISPQVAVAAGVVAATLIVAAAREVKKNTRSNMVPLMGVTGAFVFAAQMINFSIPGTGSSGHIVGGVLLASLLGRWAGFLTLCSVIIIQCLIFADGGLMALGCNIINMAAMTALVAYPYVFKPLMKGNASSARIIWVSVLACVAGLEAGVLGVVCETELSGITALPWLEFLLFMLPIHLAIGICEGLATAAVLIFVKKNRPDLLELQRVRESAAAKRKGTRRLVVTFAVAALLLGGGLAFFASEKPDGLEWSIEKVTGSTELEAADTPMVKNVEKVQTATAVMPDYDNTLSGVIGSVLVLLLVWAVTYLIVGWRKTRMRAEARRVEGKINDIRKE